MPYTEQQLKQLALSPLSFSELQAKNPEAAYYRSYGRVPTAGETLAVKMAEPKAVVTSQGARDKTLENQVKLNESEQNIGSILGEKKIPPGQVPGFVPPGQQPGFVPPGQQQPPVSNPSPPPTSPTPGAPTPPAPIVPAPEQPANEMISSEVTSYTDLLDARMVALNQASEAMINNIKATFARRKDAMAQLNKEAASGLTMAGVRTGRQRYAPEIQTGILTEEERAGIQRIADLDSQEAGLIAEARAANDEKQFSLLDKKMTAIAEARKAKQEQIAELNKQAMEQEKFALEKAKFSLEERKAGFQEELQTATFNQQAQNYDFERQKWGFTSNLEALKFDLETKKVEQSMGEQAAKTLKDAQELMSKVGDEFKKDEYVKQFQTSFPIWTRLNQAIGTEDRSKIDWTTLAKDNPAVAGIVNALARIQSPDIARILGVDENVLTSTSITGQARETWNAAFEDMKSNPDKLKSAVEKVDSYMKGQFELLDQTVADFQDRYPGVKLPAVAPGMKIGETPTSGKTPQPVTTLEDTIFNAEVENKSPGEIVSELEKTPVGRKVSVYKQAGVPDEEIIDYLKTEPKRLMNAIKQVESGGRYGAKGASGEKGAYQFMESSWKAWAKKYLGKETAPMTPANQDKVALGEIKRLLAQGYSPEEVALIWNGGQPKAKAGVNQFGVKYDSGDYAKKVTEEFKKQK